MTNAPITFLEIEGIHTAHATSGDGEALLMLHGWGAHLGLVWPLADRMSGMGYRVFVPDMPGFGQTAEPPAAWSVIDYVRWVLAYMDSQQIDRTFLFGHSFGGRLSLVLGAEHSERIHKMALADSAGVREKVPVTTRARLAAYKGIRDRLAAAGAKGLSNRLRTWYGDRYGSEDYKDVSGVMRETFVKVVNEDLLPYAARVKPSTLLFWGDRDEDTPLSQGRLLEQTIPDAGLVIHEGAGHYSYLDRLAETARVMDYFFKQ